MLVKLCCRLGSRCEGMLNIKWKAAEVMMVKMISDFRTSDAAE